MGLFRANPSIACATELLKSTQATYTFHHHRGDSRKSSPAAFERRRSFWSFFLAYKKKDVKK